MKTWASLTLLASRGNREVVDEQPDAFLRIDVFEAGALGVEREWKAPFHCWCMATSPAAMRSMVPSLLYMASAGSALSSRSRTFCASLASSVHSSMPR